MPIAFKAVMRPLDLDEAYLDRRLDFGLGYFYESGKGGQWQGGSFDVGVFPVRHVVDDTVFRIGVHVEAKLVHASDATRFGRGVAFRFTGDFARFSNGPFESHDMRGGAVGVAYGEIGAGLFVEASYEEAPPLVGRTLIGGLTVRLPAAGGLFWGWLWGR
jgi:hypothetical protein